MELIQELVGECLRKDDLHKKTKIDENLYYHKQSDSYYKMRPYDASKFDDKELAKELGSTDYYLFGIIDMDMCFPFNGLDRYHLYRLKKEPSDVIIFNYKGPCNNGLKKKPGKLEFKWMAMTKEQRNYLNDVIEKWLSQNIIVRDYPNCKVTEIISAPVKKRLKIEVSDEPMKEFAADDYNDYDDDVTTTVAFDPSDAFFFPPKKNNETEVPEEELDVMDFDDLEKYYAKGCECYYGNEPDRLQKASFYFKKAAELGDIDAQYILGTMYYKGELGNDNKKQAFANFLTAAKQGDLDSQDWLGWMYYKGLGVKKNLLVAGEWWNKAAASGHADALFNLGALYCDPEFPKMNYNVAKKWLSKSIKKGDNRARAMKEFVDKIAKGNDGKIVSKLPQEGIDGARGQYTEAISYLYGNGVEKDVRKALELMMSSADNGNVKAQFFLGRMYHKGGIVERDDSVAEKYLGDAINNGSSDAEMFLADMYLESEDENRRGRGYELVKSASKKSSPKAILRLAGYYANGEYYEKDLKQAALIYRDLADKGNNIAQYQLAKMYIGEFGMRPDYEEAAHWFVLSSANGNTKAMNQLVSILTKNEHPEFSENAIRWLDEAEKNASTEYLHGIIDLYGLSTERNVDSAMEHLMYSAENGNSVSSCTLGTIYRNGLYGIPRDNLTAEKYYQMSAEQNNPMALHNLGSMYCYGVGVKKDLAKGMDYYEKAMNGNYIPSFYDYGMLYINGKLMQPDYDKGAEYVIKAAEMDFVRAIEETARMHLHGIHFPQNTGKAIEIYQRLADNGNTNSLCALGLIYLDGIGIEKDKEKAEEYLRKSASLGFYEAEYQLYRLYMDGSESAAINWLEKAANHGHDQACIELADYYLNGEKRDEDSAIKVYESMAARGNARGSLSIVDILFARKNDLDTERAVSILNDLADKGSARAAYRLWKFYSTDEYGKLDTKKAIEYLRRSAEMDYAKGQAAYAHELETGEMTEMDLIKSLEFARAAAEKNDEFGLIVLANKYEKGLGVEQDSDESFRLYSIAAEKGNWNAILTVASFLKKGVGRKADPMKALEWYMKAVDCGLEIAGLYAGRLMLELNMDSKKAVELIDMAAKESTDAMLLLGDMYYNGDNVQEDKEKALMYLNRAKELGCEAAAEAIEKIGSD